MRTAALTLLLFLLLPAPSGAEQLRNSLNLYWGRMSNNHWEEVLQPAKIDLADSYLVAASYARRLGGIGDYLSFEVESQLVRHYRRQTHWEANLLGSVRWEPFIWDAFLDTSLAFGLGPSWATQPPQVEIDNDGQTRRLLAYWMLELAISLPGTPDLALIGRLHHRSDAYGLFAPNGGSTAPAIGIKLRF